MLLSPSNEDFSHDLGKAMDHDIEGTHPEIGMVVSLESTDLMIKTVNIIEGHHDDVAPDMYRNKIIYKSPMPSLL